MTFFKVCIDRNCIPLNEGEAEKIIEAKHRGETFIVLARGAFDLRSLFVIVPDEKREREYRTASRWDKKDLLSLPDAFKTLREKLTKAITLRK